MRCGKICIVNVIFFSFHLFILIFTYFFTVVIAIFTKNCLNSISIWSNITNMFDTLIFTWIPHISNWFQCDISLNVYNTFSIFCIMNEKIKKKLFSICFSIIVLIKNKNSYIHKVNFSARMTKILCSNLYYSTNIFFISTEQMNRNNWIRISFFPSKLWEFQQQTVFRMIQYESSF